MSHDPLPLVAGVSSHPLAESQRLADLHPRLRDQLAQALRSVPTLRDIPTLRSESAQHGMPEIGALDRTDIARAEFADSPESSPDESPDGFPDGFPDGSDAVPLPQVDLPRLLELISAHYEQLDAERRGIVRSMQLIADEARSFGEGLAGSDPGHLQAVLDHIQDVVITVSTDGVIKLFNPTGERAFGYSREEVLGRPIAYLLPELPVNGSVERGLAALIASPGESPREPRALELSARHKQGHRFIAELNASRVRIGKRDVFVLCLRDTSERVRAERLTAGERDVFEHIAADAPLPQVLAAIAALVETGSDDGVVAIGRLDARGQSFTEVIGERLPDRWRAIEQGISVDMRNGSAAAAVYLGRQVLAADITSDPFWQRRREQAVEAGFRAAWSVPILAPRGRVLGAVTVYRAVSGAPGPRDLALLTHAARLAAVAIQRQAAEAALRRSESKFRSLYERVLDGVYQCDPDGRLTEVNPALVKMLGYAEAGQLYALPGIASLYRERSQRSELERALAEQGTVHNAEVVLCRPDGSEVVALESARLMRDESGRVLGYEGTLTDISARKAAEQAMFAEKERAEVTLQSIGDAVITTDRDGRIDYMNPVAERLTGWSREAARGERLAAVMRLLDELTEGELDHPLARCLREGQVVHSAEHSLLVNRQGQEIAIQDSAAPIRNRSGEIVGAVVVFRDVTRERRLKRALAYQASHDALTGLINRRELDNRLADALRSAHEQRQTHALLYMDLDQFKLVNDACGHGAGDRLLRDITGLLQAQVRVGDTIARLGGDEFGILMQRCTAAEAARVAEAIRESVEQYRFRWDDHVSRVGVSIGVVEISPSSQNVAELLSAADIACYAAKDAGRNRVHLYDAHHDDARQRDLYWVGRVTRALEHQQLELFCQPIVPLGAAGGQHPPLHELLVRLRDDDGELILPRHFIPAAERYNVVGAIDRWVLSNALQVLREPPLPDAEVGVLAINLSGVSLSDRSFLEFVLAQLDSAPLGQRLCFEVSESTVLRNMSETREFMRELRQRGCRFALSNWGGPVLVPVPAQPAGGLPEARRSVHRAGDDRCGGSLPRGSHQPRRPGARDRHGGRKGGVRGSVRRAAGAGGAAGAGPLHRRPRAHRAARRASGHRWAGRPRQACRRRRGRRYKAPTAGGCKPPYKSASLTTAIRSARCRRDCSCARGRVPITVQSTVTGDAISQWNSSSLVRGSCWSAGCSPVPTVNGRYSGALH
jgi:diguanylate cyclase (GGDEF)-like protein/PAS domain S-box-containing protein